MIPQERQLIDDLFDRLSKVENAPRDPEAAAAITQGLRQAPNAIYALVQTVLVQDEALKRAHDRIQELEGALSYAEVIDVTRLNPNGRIVFGATVHLADEDSGEEVTYQIVGDLEADIKQRLISVSSPIARALIGKSEGDSFEFTASNGTKRYEIISVRYQV